jgi:hypothetical protein
MNHCRSEIMKRLIFRLRVFRSETLNASATYGRMCGRRHRLVPRALKLDLPGNVSDRLENPGRTVMMRLTYRGVAFTRQSAGKKSLCVGVDFW